MVCNGKSIYQWMMTGGIHGYPYFRKPPTWVNHQVRQPRPVGKDPFRVELLAVIHGRLFLGYSFKLNNQPLDRWEKELLRPFLEYG